MTSRTTCRLGVRISLPAHQKIDLVEVATQNLEEPVEFLVGRNPTLRNTDIKTAFVGCVLHQAIDSPVRDLIVWRFISMTPNRSPATSRVQEPAGRPHYL
jgi:hypothetical protein